MTCCIDEHKNCVGSYFHQNFIIIYIRDIELMARVQDTYKN